MSDDNKKDTQNPNIQGQETQKSQTSLSEEDLKQVSGGLVCRKSGKEQQEY